ncbi:MAG TPA: hypothetical protein VFZ65_03110 [Planctomycetota bacterium]|nr:hypothetical protein [Planctomycetota bacterium]
MVDDTSPKVQALVANMLAALSPARRMAMVRDLTSATIGWSRRAVRDAMPDASQQEVLLRWVAVTYGDDIADRLRTEGRPLGT